MSMTDVEMQQLAESLGIPVSQLKSPGFPTFRAGKGYKLKVVGAQNVVGKGWSEGASQVELAVVAVDETGEVNQRAKGKIWVSYPFDTADYKFAAPDRETAINQMGALLEASGDSRFVPFKRVDVGGKMHYFTLNDEELKGPAITTAKNATRIEQLKEMRVRQSDASAWVGTTFYAYLEPYTNKSGEHKTKWKRFSAAPLSTVEYILEAAKMLARPEGDEGAEDTAF